MSTLHPVRIVLAASAACIALALPPGDARAQGVAISTQLDPSIRIAGMGQAGAAVFWGDDPDSWSNPALLGYHRGVRYAWGETQLVPDLADDVYFTTKQTTLGGFGLGFAFAGQPGDLGSIRLDYGISDATDESGNPLGSFHSYEEVDSWGIGLSVGQATEAIALATSGKVPTITRYFDLALGMTKKDVTVALSPGFLGLGSAEGSSEDRGWLVRVTPWDTITPRAGDAGTADAARSLRLRFDLAYGASTKNVHSPTLTFVVDDRTDPMTEESRQGLAARIALHPSALDRALEQDGLGLLARSLMPLVSLGLTSENQTNRTPGTTNPEYDVDKSGVELALGNIFWWRRGHYTDADAHVDGTTTGWGLGFTLAGTAGLRYDHATVPQPSGVDDLEREGWTFFVDPIRAIAVF